MQLTTAFKVMFIALLLITTNSSLTAANETLPAGILKHHQQWNGFVDKLYQLHRKKLNNHDYYTFERVGGYGGTTRNFEFYREVKYFDRKSRQLMSIIKWDNTYPFGIHMIDLFAYDKQGRVKREYSATYLPSRHISPFETLITLHYYKGDLHSLREFDASNILLYEQCIEMNNSNTVFSYHYEDIPMSVSEVEKDMQDAYRACFPEKNKTAEPYTDPLKDPLL